MTTTMTARDKTLLYFVALGSFLFIFVRFLFFPALESHAEAVDTLANNEALQEDMENSLMLAPAAAQEKTNAYEDLNTNSAVYYSKLKSDELDSLVTGLELRHNLLPLTLSIGEPTPQSLTGYVASGSAGQTAGPGAAPAAAPTTDTTDTTDTTEATDTAAQAGTGRNLAGLANVQSLLPGVDWAAAYEQAGYFTTATVSFSADGDRADFLALLDDLSVNYPSIQLQSFSITDKQATNAEGNVSTSSTVSAQLTVILCDKEGVPAL